MWKAVGKINQNPFLKEENKEEILFVQLISFKTKINLWAIEINKVVDFVY